MTIEIVTDRLIIRSTKIADADFCINIWLDENMGKYLSDPPRDKAGDLYDKWKASVETYDGCYYFVAVSKASHDYVGTSSLVPSQDLSEWDMGYCIHEDYQRQGYGQEMIRGLIDFCTQRGGSKVIASVAKENEASNGLIRKMGFKVMKEGRFQKARTDIYYDEYIYSYSIK